MERVFDIQVNGYIGIGFDDKNLSLEKVHKISKAIQKDGEYHYLATIITSSWSVILKNAEIIEKASKENDSKGLLRGIHLEGPFISAMPGAIGAHNPDLVILPTIEKVTELMQASNNFLKLITIAPEVEGAIEFIKQVKEKYPKLVVSLGHHLASSTDINNAIKAGATMATHFGNGIPNEIHRHQNPLWAQLASDKIITSIITDGTHLPNEFITTVFKAKGIGNSIVTSDCSSVAGLAPGNYGGLGQELVINEDGSVRTMSGGLAGSAKNLYECVEFLRKEKLVDEESIKKLVWDNPLALFG